MLSVNENTLTTFGETARYRWENILLDIFILLPTPFSPAYLAFRIRQIEIGAYLASVAVCISAHPNIVSIKRELKKQR